MLMESKHSTSLPYVSHLSPVKDCGWFVPKEADGCEIKLWGCDPATTSDSCEPCTEDAGVFEITGRSKQAAKAL